MKNRHVNGMKRGTRTLEWNIFATSGSEQVMCRSDFMSFLLSISLSCTGTSICSNGGILPCIRPLARGVCVCVRVMPNIVFMPIADAKHRRKRSVQTKVFS